MKNYVEMELDLSTRLINHGPVVWVCSKGADGKYDLAPIAWNSPVAKSPPKVIVEIGTRHQTFQNIESSKEFIVAVPHKAQADLVRKTGSVSGAQADKYKEMAIDSFAGSKVDAQVPHDCIGYLECKVEKIMEVGPVAVVAAEVLAGFVDSEAFDGMLLVQKEAGKTLHHLGDRFFAVPGDEILENK